MTPEQKLSALFAAEAPPARDYAFQARVAQAIALRRAWMTVAALVPWAVAAVAVLWALVPVIGPMGDSLGAALQPAAAMLAGAAATAICALWLSWRFNRRFRGPFNAG
ncbi:MAG: hypothetical protein Q8R45_07990 [Brevundimonas sp.]|uniref:hypothetical protein n=1 Tax=Brevundimonas sp. TaxID=1871086 RepID=UPI0027291598|nr:hypothetical protein [Brevundimonas sp.]MDO9587758.1 hypothetical protein [Brevundimonas sp.]MDP3656888.1 hypothetical protein [Brevundimonas sp.]MDZ4108775.1 hypothetical protein [Brevundimonas sp.]